MSEPTDDPYQTNDGGTLFEPPPPPELKLGAILADKYRLIQEIGSDGMGVVWSAEELTSEKEVLRKVAMKFVQPELQNFEKAVKQVRAKFDIIKKLKHPNICQHITLDSDSTFGYYYVMELLEGETLDEYIVRTVGYHQPISLAEVKKILEPVAKVLDYAHGKGIIHRDIKPANIFLVLDKSQKIKDVQLIDFGIAVEIRNSLTGVSNIQFDNSGTRLYMAPEQWRSRPQSEATDQYALAAVAYELLSGYPPFIGDDSANLKKSVLEDPPEPIAGQPEHVNTALLKALSKDAINRFASCGEFLKVLAASSGAVKPSDVLVQQPHADGKQAGDRMVLTIKGVEYPFRWCPSGTFLMGNQGIELISQVGHQYSNCETQHQVTLTRGFWMLETQVTQAMWKSVMGNNPSHFKGGIFRGCGRLPVENVSWNACQEYIEKLYNLGIAPSGYKFSLPTETQWEYACRADTTTPFNFGREFNFDGEYNVDKMNCKWEYPRGYTKPKNMWFLPNKTTDVGSYPANAWGLYDMHGNVLEWCSDWYGEYEYYIIETDPWKIRECVDNLVPMNYTNYSRGSRDIVTDPVGPSTGTRHVLRGGSWSSKVENCRSSYRTGGDPSDRSNTIGLRLSLVREEPVQRPIPP